MARIIVMMLAIGAAWFVVGPLLRAAGRSASDPEEDGFRQRRTLALEAIVELEDDLSMGKLTQEDFDDLKARYQTDAIEALRGERSLRGDIDPLEAEIEKAKRRL